MDPGAQFIQRLGVPPAVHVGFACCEAPVRQQSLVEALVVNPQVPRAVATNLDAGKGEDFRNLLSSGVRTPSSN
jgi:hypothetical protein